MLDLLSSSTLLDGLLAELDSLPLSVNRYNATADYIIRSSTVLAVPRSGAEEIAIYVLYAAFSITIIAAIALLYCRKAVRLSAWFTYDRGLITPNASNFLALTISLYGVFVIIEMSTELTTGMDLLGVDSRQWDAWVGIRYLPLYLCAIAYFWAIAASCLRVVERNRDVLVDPRQLRSSRRRWTVAAWAVNLSAICLSLFLVTSIPICFGLSSHYGSPFREAIVATLADLYAVAPAYNPSTFSTVILLPHLATLNAALPGGNLALNFFRLGWLIWQVLACLILAMLTPFSLYQLRLLRKLAELRREMKTPTDPSQHGSGLNEIPS